MYIGLIWIVIPKSNADSYENVNELRVQQNFLTEPLLSSQVGFLSIVTFV
jgi:hypothetical protein